MKYQVLFSLKNNEKMSSAAVVTGALRVKSGYAPFAQVIFSLKNNEKIL